MPEDFIDTLPRLPEGQAPSREPSFVDTLPTLSVEGVDPVEYARRTREAGLMTGRSLDDQYRLLKEKGYNDDFINRQITAMKVGQAKKQMDSYRYEGGGETLLGDTIAGSMAAQMKRLGTPFRSFFVNEQKKVQDAQKRFAEGNPTDEDIWTMARTANRAEFDQRLHDSGIGGEVIGGLRAAPAIVGEFMTGASILKGAGILQSARATLGGTLASGTGRVALTTAMAPSFYAEAARQKNVENGRDADDWRGYGPAYAHAFAQVAVLGHVFRMAGPASPGVTAFAKNTAARGVTGAVEIGLADSVTNLVDTALPKAYQISTGYGTFEKLMTGDVSGAARKFAVDSLTMAAFAGMHSLADGLSRPEQVTQEVAQGFGRELEQLKRSGFSEPAALAKVQAQIDLFKRTVGNGPDAAQKLRDYFRFRNEGFNPQDAYRKAFGPDAQIPGPANTLTGPRQLAGRGPVSPETGTPPPGGGRSPRQQADQYVSRVRELMDSGVEPAEAHRRARREVYGEESSTPDLGGSPRQLVGKPDTAPNATGLRQLGPARSVGETTPTTTVARPASVEATATAVGSAARRALGENVIVTEDGMVYHEVGGRIIEIAPTEVGRVTINFAEGEARADGRLEGEALDSSVRSGSKELLTALNSTARELAKEGVEIEYSAEPNRHDVYSSGLKRAGYELVSQRREGNTQTHYVWKPTGKSGEATGPGEARRSKWEERRADRADAELLSELTRPEPEPPEPPAPPTPAAVVPTPKIRGSRKSKVPREGVLEKLTPPEGASPELATAIERLRKSIESHDPSDSLKDVGNRVVSAWLHHSRRGNAEVSEHLGGVLRSLGYESVGVVGDVAPFNGRIHEAEFGVSDQAPVRVARQGWFELGEKGPTDGPKSRKTVLRALVVRPETPVASAPKTRGSEVADEPVADRAELARAQLAVVFDKAGLTAPQKWALTQYAKGRTMDDIAAEAGVKRQAIWERLKGAQKKIAKLEGAKVSKSFFEDLFKGIEAERASMGEAGVRGVDVTGAPVESTKKRVSATSDVGQAEAAQREIEKLTNQWLNAKTPEKQAEIKAKIDAAEARRSEAQRRTFLRSFLEEEGGYLDLAAIRDWVLKNFFRAKDWVSWAFSTGKGNPPGVRFDNVNPIPRPAPWGEYKKTVADPQGGGRVPFFRWLFDPLRSDTSPESEVFVANQAMKETGRDVAALWALREREADKLFQTAEDGTYTRANGTRGRMADDIEAHMANPSGSRLSPEQQRWVDKVWTPLLRDAQKMMAEYKIADYTDEFGNLLTTKAVAYFPRTAIGKKGVDTTTSNLGGSPGAKASFQKDRLYRSEEEGSQEIIYDPSAKSRVAKFIANLYRVVADKQMSEDPALGGETVESRYRNIVAQNATWLNTLSPQARADAMAEMKSMAAHPSWGKELRVGVGPAFAGKIYPKEIAEKLEKQFAQENAAWLKNAEKISAAAKGIMLGGDMSYATIQLLPLFFRNPRAWARAMKNGVLSIFNRQHMAEYLEDPANALAARELVQLGSSVGRLQDFMRGLSEGEAVSRIPILGKIYEAAGRGYGTAMDVAKIELWKAWKPKDPSQYRAVAEAIDSMILTGRMEGIGLSPRRQLLERLLMLAPAYYRGGVNLIATAFQRGEAGYRARQGLGAMMAGVTIATVAAMKAAGLSDDEIGERLDPSRGKFLKVPIDLGDNRSVEFGTSNILTSYVRLLGAGAEHFGTDRPIDTGADGNPILRWLRGKAAFSPRLAVDIWTGKDYFGERIEPSEAVVRSFEPLLLQQLLHGQGGVFEKGLDVQSPGRENVADALSSFFGFSSYPGGYGDRKMSALDAEAKGRYGKAFNDLSIREQAAVVKLAERRPDYPQKEPASATVIERAAALQTERQRAVTNRVSSATREKLLALDKALPGYSGSLSVNGTDVPMSRSRMSRYEELLAEEYDRAAARWDVATLKKMFPEARERRLRDSLSEARERAQKRLMREGR